MNLEWPNFLGPGSVSPGRIVAALRALDTVTLGPVQTDILQSRNGHCESAVFTMRGSPVTSGPSQAGRTQASSSADNSVSATTNPALAPSKASISQVFPA